MSKKNLENLDKLFKMGVLSETEYQEQKDILLGNNKSVKKTESKVCCVCKKEIEVNIIISK
jgi:hypothetical protein